jgi:hypothetical protein
MKMINLDAKNKNFTPHQTLENSSNDHQVWKKKKKRHLATGT